MSVTRNNRKAGRSAPGWPLARGFVEWLNNPDDRKLVKRVSGLIVEINELTRNAPKRLKGRKGRLRPPKQDTAYRSPEEMYWFMQLFMLNQPLARRHFSVQFSYVLADLSWKVDWVSVNTKDKFAAHVFLLARLAERGWLWRIQQCPKCSTWFYALLKRQRFCSNKCRQKHYRLSSKGTKARKTAIGKYQRKYYSNARRKR